MVALNGMITPETQNLNSNQSHSEQQSNELNNFRLFLGFHLQSQKKEPPGEANETVAYLGKFSFEWSHKSISSTD